MNKEFLVISLNFAVGEHFFGAGGRCQGCGTESMLVLCLVEICHAEMEG